MKFDFIKFFTKPKLETNLFFVYGEEIVLRNDVIEIIEKGLNKVDFNKTLTIGIETEDLKTIETLVHKLSAGSLFQEKIIVKIKHLEGRFPAPLISFIESYEFKKADGLAFIIESVGEKHNVNNNWYKKLDTEGTIVSCKKLALYEEKIWLKENLSFLSKEHLPLVGSTIIANFEGNLIAQKNEIKLLKMIQESDIENDIASIDFNKSFVGYELEDALITQDYKKSRQIVQEVKTSNPNAHTLLNWVFAKVVHAALALKFSSGRANLYSYGVWKAKHNDYKSFSKKTSHEILLEMKKAIFKLDQLSKGAKRGDAWECLESSLIKLQNSS